MGRIVDWSPVQEITDGRLYDVRALNDGEEIGTAVPPWVARLIVSDLDYAIVRVHGHHAWGPPPAVISWFRRLLAT